MHTGPRGEVGRHMEFKPPRMIASRFDSGRGHQKENIEYKWVQMSTYEHK